MNRFEELLDSVTARPKTVVQLGAGTSSVFEPYDFANSGRFILVEPDQFLAEVCADSLSDLPDTKVIRRAIAAERGTRILNITNNRRFSSLLLPDKLLDFYPNVEVNSLAEVEAVTLADICRDEGIHKDSENLLVAELNGMENEVFYSADSDTLQKFKWIIVRSSEIDLYKQSTDHKPYELAEVMEEAGFVVLVYEEHTPPFTNVLCLRHDDISGAILLRSKGVRLLAASKAAAEKPNQRIKKLDELRISQEVTIKQLQDALNISTVEKEQIRSEIQLLTECREKQKKQIRTHTVERENQQKQLHKLSLVVDTKSNQLKEAQATVESIKAEREQQQQHINELTESFKAEKEQQQQHINELTESIKQKSSEVMKMQQMLNVKSKLVRKSDADLRDLQLQYKTVVQSQEQQQALLGELIEKLRLASACYQKLKLQNHELDFSALEHEKL